jgi:hypothetical protein
MGRAGWAGVVRRDPVVVRAEAKAEVVRVASVKAQATPPADVGPVPVAPARGPQRVVTEFVALPGGMRRAVGRRLEEADVFDVMLAQAARRHGDSEARFTPPLSHGQIAMARHYRALVERHEAGGVKCSSLEAGRAGGSGGDFMDAYLAVGREIDQLRARIGAGSALVLRRVRPSERGSRVTIADRMVVDLVCLGNLTFDAVLVAHGWSVCREYRQGLLTALVGALDRMQGYRGAGPTT